MMTDLQGLVLLWEQQLEGMIVYLLILMFVYIKNNIERIFYISNERKNQAFGSLNKLDLLASNVVNHNVVILTYRSTYDYYSLI